MLDLGATLLLRKNLISRPVTDPSVDLRPCFILLNFRSCAIERAACWFPCSWDISLVPTGIILTNVNKDGDTERCWHAWESVSMKRSALLNIYSLTISAARVGDILLQPCSLSRPSDSTCAMSFSNTSNTGLPPLRICTQSWNACEYFVFKSRWVYCA